MHWNWNLDVLRAKPVSRTAGAVAIAGLMICTALLAAGQPPAGPNGAKMPAAEAFVQAKAMLPQGIEYLPDIEYASVLGFRPLTLELYLPADKKPTPVVVYIHGGGFELGSTRMPKTPAGDWPLVTLAARGYVMAGVAYRMTGEAKFPVAVQDVKAAIRFLRAHAAEYNLDPNRIGVWGESAGGYLTAIMATSCGAKEFEGVGENKDQSSCVQSAVDWFGPIDFAAMQTRKKPRRVRPRRARRRP